MAWYWKCCIRMQTDNLPSTARYLLALFAFIRNCLRAFSFLEGKQTTKTQEGKIPQDIRVFPGYKRVAFLSYLAGLSLSFLLPFPSSLYFLHYINIRLSIYHPIPPSPCHFTAMSFQIDASNLANELILCLNCRVMLQENIWTETGW